MKAIVIGTLAILLLGFMDEQIYFGRHVDQALAMLADILRAFGL